MGVQVVAYVHRGCRTCRRATDLLDSRNISYSTRELYEETPTKAELRYFLETMGLSARDLLRPRDRAYRELDLKNRKLSDEDLLALMLEHPGLIKRPILVRGRKVVLGLKPEHVERLLEEIPK